MNNEEKVKRTFNILFLVAFAISGLILVIVFLINGWDILKPLFILGTMLIAYLIKIGAKKLVSGSKKEDDSYIEEESKIKSDVEHYDDDFWG